MLNANGGAKFIDAAKARELLMEFLTSHTPQPRVSEIDFRGARVVAVSAPWGDETVRLHLPEDAGELIDTLNAVALPTRYSAIWHKDSKELVSCLRNNLNNCSVAGVSAIREAEHGAGTAESQVGGGAE